MSRNAEGIPTEWIFADSFIFVLECLFAIFYAFLVQVCSEILAKYCECTTRTPIFPNSAITSGALMVIIFCALKPLLSLITQYFNHLVALKVDDRDDGFDLKHWCLMNYKLVFILTIIAVMLSIIWTIVSYFLKNKDKRAKEEEADAVTAWAAVIVIEVLMVILNVSEWANRFLLDIDPQTIGYFSAEIAVFCFFAAIFYQRNDNNSTPASPRVEEDDDGSGTSIVHTQEERFNQSHQLETKRENVYQYYYPFADNSSTSLFQISVSLLFQHMLMLLYNSIIFEFQFETCDENEEPVGHKIGGCNTSETGYTYFFIASLAVCHYIIGEKKPLKSVRDSIKYWRAVLAEIRKESCWIEKRKVVIYVLIFADAYTNIFIAVYVLLLLPYQSSYQSKPLDFMLNLMGVFYIIEIDNFAPLGREVGRKEITSINNISKNIIKGEEVAGLIAPGEETNNPSSTNEEQFAASSLSSTKILSTQGGTTRAEHKGVETFNEDHVADVA